MALIGSSSLSVAWLRVGVAAVFSSASLASEDIPIPAYRKIKHCYRIAKSEVIIVN